MRCIGHESLICVARCYVIVLLPCTVILSGLKPQYHRRGRCRRNSATCGLNSRSDSVPGCVHRQDSGGRFA
jgi:hypothetical protein